MRRAFGSASAPGRAGAPAPRSEAAYAHLMTRLLEGDLGPGDKLSVIELTRRLGCSRVPVMEALKRLEGEGFVAIVPQVGVRVVAPEAEQVRDFFALFAAVESTVTGFAAGRRTVAEVARFAATCEYVEREARAAGGPAAADPAYRRLNLIFHGSIHDMAHSPVTTRIAAGLWDRSDFYIKLAFGSLYFSARVRAAHRAIRDAIVAGDETAAAAAVAGHLLTVGARVAERLGGEAPRTGESR